MRPKYCVPLRICVAPNTPVSIMGVEQGILSAAGVPQTLAPRTALAVCETVTPDTPTGWYLVSTPVPTDVATVAPVRIGELVPCAHVMNAGSANVTDPPALADERSGSTEK